MLPPSTPLSASHWSRTRAHSSIRQVSVLIRWCAHGAVGDYQVGLLAPSGKICKSKGVDLCISSAQGSWGCCFLTPAKCCGILKIHMTLNYRLLDRLLGSIQINWVNPSLLKEKPDFIGLKWTRAVCPTLHTWTYDRYRSKMSKSCNLPLLSALKILV